MNEQSEDKCDRELFSELLELPIHPLLIHLVPPFIEENNPVFILQMNGEAAWRFRDCLCSVNEQNRIFYLL